MKKLSRIYRKMREALEDDNANEELGIAEEISRIKRTYIELNGHPVLSADDIAGMPSLYRSTTSHVQDIKATQGKW